MTPKSTWFLAFAAAPVLIAAQTTKPSAPAVPRVDSAVEPACRVVNVLTNATVVVDIRGDKTSVTLLGAMIERRGPQLEAVDAFLDRVLTGEEVNVIYDPAHVQNDDRGRRAVYLFRVPDGLFINLELVRLGYAATDMSIDFEHRELFRQYESRAKQSEKGIWARDAAASDSADTAAKSKSDKSVGSGGEKAKSHGESSAARIKVFCRRSGDRYHLATCHYAEGADEITLADARERGLKPCSKCKPPP